MGPNRIVHNRRGYITETVYDAERGGYTERPFPPNAAQTPEPSPKYRMNRVLSAVERRDGALNAMVLPFLHDVPSCLHPSFRHGIDSLSTSGHKMIGTPMPCGVLIARRPHVARVARAIAYLRSDDTTLMGSRNGHAVLAVWARLMGHGIEGFRHDAETCRQRTETLADDLRAQGVPVLLNPFSLTVLFPEPDPAMVKRFQLSCSGGQAHAIVMPNVGEDQLRRFRDAYLAWWDAEAGARSIAGEVTKAQESGTFAAS